MKYFIEIEVTDGALPSGYAGLAMALEATSNALVELNQKASAQVALLAAWELHHAAGRMASAFRARNSLAELMEKDD